MCTLKTNYCRSELWKIHTGEEIKGELQILHSIKTFTLYHLRITSLLANKS